MTIQVILETENNKDTDPLIIKESVSSLVESIEASIYNINETYREYIRKIRNRLNLFESKNTSDNVYLENSIITDNNIIESVNNILEITIDLTLKDLIKDNYNISFINNTNDLFELQHNSIENLKYIFDQSKQILNYYQENNKDTEFDNYLFYNILDESISKLVLNTSEPEYDICQDFSINDCLAEQYYKYVNTNLDRFVDENLELTKVNIKKYIINESNFTLVSNSPGSNNSRYSQKASYFGFLLTLFGSGILVWLTKLTGAKIFAGEQLNKLKELEADKAAGKIIPGATKKLEELNIKVEEAKQLAGTFPIWASWGITFALFVITLLYFVYNHSITAQDFLLRFRILRNIEKEINTIKKTLPNKIGSSKVNSFLGKLEVDTRKCISFSESRSRIDANTICFENYINGVMALLIFGSLNNLNSDGVNPNKFRKFDDLFSYTGFASEKSRVYLQQLQDLHKYNVEYMKLSNNYNLVDYIDTIFGNIKDAVLKNIPFDQIWNRLPKVRK